MASRLLKIAPLQTVHGMCLPASLTYACHTQPIAKQSTKASFSQMLQILTLRWGCMVIVLLQCAANHQPQQSLLDAATEMATSNSWRIWKQTHAPCVCDTSCLSFVGQHCMYLVSHLCLLDMHTALHWSMQLLLALALLVHCTELPVKVHC